MSQALSTRRSSLQCEQLEDRLALDAASFVKSLYQNLLKRTADSSGLSFWINQIQNNGLSNQQVAADFWRSAEHRGIEVTSYYENFLGRSPDASGRAFWVNLLVSGRLNEQGVEAQFLTSPEYLAAHNSASTFVQGLYLDLLNRLPSSNELAGWVDTANAFGAAAVTAGIITSSERYIDVIDGYYVHYLDRSPDSTGLDHWLSALANNQASVESVAEGILGSTEYANDH